MKSENATFFESKVRLDRPNEEGLMVKFVELYVVNAMSFTETESKMTEYISGIAQGEFEVLTETKAPYKEIFFSEKDDEDLFFKVKVDFITLDDKSGKEKHSRNVYLVQASSTETAGKNMDEAMAGTMIDYRILSIAETNILDYIK